MKGDNENLKHEIDVCVIPQVQATFYETPLVRSMLRKPWAIDGKKPYITLNKKRTITRIFLYEATRFTIPGQLPQV